MQISNLQVFEKWGSLPGKNSQSWYLSSFIYADANFLFLIEMSKLDADF